MIVLFLGVTSVAFLVSGPKILGDATNVLFNGIVSQSAGLTKAQAIAALRAHGPGPARGHDLRDEHHPRRGVDLTRLGQVLGIVALLYLAGAAFSRGQPYLMAGVTQRTKYGLRRAVEDRLGSCRCGLLQPPARRHPQPGRQRHRQPHHHPAARDSAS